MDFDPFCAADGPLILRRHDWKNITDRIAPEKFFSANWNVNLGIPARWAFYPDNSVLAASADAPISASKKPACISSGEMLLPRGLAAHLSVSRKRFTHLMGALGLTSN